VKTFTIAFDDPAFDEGAHARAVADHLGTSHTNFLVSPADAQAAVPDLAAIFDEPFGDSSAVPQLLVSRLARRHVTVALSGDGGDEVFAGYTRHLWADRVQRVSRKLPGVAREMVAGAFDSASPETWDRLYHRVRPYLPGRWRLSHPGEKLQKLAAAMRAPSAAALYETLAAPGMRGAMASPSAAAATLAPPSSSGSFVDYMLLRDLTEYLPDDILTKVDRATMAASLEARAPLLDYRVVEWGALIDPALRARDGRGKWVLRQVLARYVPPALFDRPKTGFALPVGQWLRGPLRDWAESLLSVRALAETDGIDADRVRDLWDAHLSGRRNLQAPLWIVLMLQAWHERWHAAGAAR
jgi:asparagine synthase (glutamine-hydrolysing)